MKKFNKENIIYIVILISLVIIYLQTKHKFSLVNYPLKKPFIFNVLLYIFVFGNILIFNLLNNFTKKYGYIIISVINILLIVYLIML